MPTVAIRAANLQPHSHSLIATYAVLSSSWFGVLWLLPLVSLPSHTAITVACLADMAVELAVGDSAVGGTLAVLRVLRIFRLLRLLRLSRKWGNLRVRHTTARMDTWARGTCTACTRTLPQPNGLSFSSQPARPGARGVAGSSCHARCVR